MQRKGKEYLEDRLIAQSFANEEKLAAEQIKSKKLKPYRDKVDEALALYLNAQDNVNALPSELEQLKDAYESAQRRLEFEEKELNRSPSTQAKLLAGVLRSAEIKDEKKATPYRVFAADEMKLINQHYEKIPEELKKLMDAALGEDINLLLAANPVFIRTEGFGHIYDRDTLMQLLKHGEAMCPHNQDKKYTEADIIPCNSLLKAMDHLLNIIKGAVFEDPKLEPALSVTDEIKAVKRARIPANVVDMIEAGYKKMLPHRKVLFNSICRDPITNIIMDDPVLLPDGYIYDRCTAMGYLKYNNGQCPLKPSIKFTKDEIIPCLTVGKVLDQLRDNILAEAAKMGMSVQKNENAVRLRA